MGIFPEFTCLCHGNIPYFKESLRGPFYFIPYLKLPERNQQGEGVGTAANRSVLFLSAPSQRCHSFPFLKKSIRQKAANTSRAHLSESVVIVRGCRIITQDKNLETSSDAEK